MINLGTSLYVHLWKCTAINLLYDEVRVSVIYSLIDEVRNPIWREGEWQDFYSMEVFQQRINSK